MKILKSITLFSICFYLINISFVAFKIFILGQDNYKFGSLGTFTIVATAMTIFGLMIIFIYTITCLILNKFNDGLTAKQEVTIGSILILMVLTFSMYSSIETYRNGNPHSTNTLNQKKQRLTMGRTWCFRFASNTSKPGR